MPLTAQIVGDSAARASISADLPGGFDGADQVRSRIYFVRGTNLFGAAAGIGLLFAGASTAHTRTPTPDTITAHVITPPVNKGLWIWTDADRTLTPPQIAAGTLIVDQNHSVQIWNNQDPVIVTSITLSSLPGVSISGPTLPALLKTGGELIFDVTIIADGSANLDGSIVVTVQGLPAFGIAVTGQRIVYLMPDPNWSSSTTIEISFDTLIQSSRSGQEQRSSRRISPARTFSYTLNMIADDELPDFRKRVALATGRPVATASWMDGLTLTTAANTSDTTVTTDSTTARRFVTGGQCILWQAFNNFVIADIVAVNSSSLTVAPLSAGIPIGSRVFPLILCEPMALTKATLTTDTMAQGSIELIEDLAQVVPTAAAPAWQAYKGFPVFELPADWANTKPSNAFGTDVVRNVLGPGRREIVIRGKQVRIQQTVESLVFDAATALPIEGFFRDRLGRLLPFWFADLVPLSTVVSDATGAGVTLRSINYATYYAGAIGTSRKYLAIVDMQGNILPRQITSVTDNGDGTETYAVDSAIGLTRPQIDRVSLLLFVRFDQDVLSLQYITDEYARATLTVNEIPFEVPA